MTIAHRKTSIVVRFREPVRIVSSAAVGGGLLRADTIVNLHTSSARILKNTPETLISRFVKKQRLNPQAVGLLTAAPLEYAQFILIEENGIKVLAVVTAGTSNALNIAERTSTSRSGEDLPAVGTINIVLITSATLTDDCMISSVISATEAKSAALISLKIKSVATGSQATGTGTDAVVVVSGKGVPVRYAGGHTLFGQLIGEAVHSGIEKALLKKKHTHSSLKEICGAFDF